jgi:hypothetical protein
MNATSKRHAMGFLVGCVMLAAPQWAAAEGIQVNPTAWDYGDVEVGQSRSLIVTITSTEPIPLRVESVEIIDDETGSFSIVSDAPPPTVSLDEGYTLDVTVEFTPSGLGMHSATLYIRSDAEDPDDDFFVPLFGVGVEADGEPGERMAETIGFFDDSVALGSLDGSGPGNAAQGRLRAFGNMLDAADDLIEAGEFELACEQLWDAYDRADGFHPPPDFVVGDASEELAGMILDVIIALGCM